MNVRRFDKITNLRSVQDFKKTDFNVRKKSEDEEINYNLSAKLKK